MKNQTWIDRLKAVECQDSSFLAANPPLVFQTAGGSTVWDADDLPYIDLCAGFGVLALGHAHEVSRGVFKRHAALSGQAPLMHAMGDVYPSTKKVELLEVLLGLLPKHLTKGALALTGGQAVELAVKTAIIATKSSGFIVFQGAYHGLDLGLLPLVSREDFRQPFASWQKLGNVVRLDYGCSADAVRMAIKDLKDAGVGFAGIIVEPIQGRAGVRIPPKGWLQLLKDECVAENGLLIFDEIFTGLGRTGRVTFAAEVECDLLCLGKALGGGIPLSACVGSEKAMSAWPENQGEAIHTGTFFGHPLSCEMALATLEFMKRENLFERSRVVGAEVLSYLQDTFGQHKRVKDIRGEGLMLAIEFKEEGFGVLLMDALRAKGVIALCSGEKGQCLSITPALIVDRPMLKEAIDRIRTTLDEL